MTNPNANIVEQLFLSRIAVYIVLAEGNDREDLPLEASKFFLFEMIQVQINDDEVNKIFSHYIIPINALNFVDCSANFLAYLLFLFVTQLLTLPYSLVSTNMNFVSHFY